MIVKGEERRDFKNYLELSLKYHLYTLHSEFMVKISFIETFSVQTHRYNLGRLNTFSVVERFHKLYIL